MSEEHLLRGMTRGDHTSCDQALALVNDNLAAISLREARLRAALRVHLLPYIAAARTSPSVKVNATDIHALAAALEDKP